MFNFYQLFFQFVQDNGWQLLELLIIFLLAKILLRFIVKKIKKLSASVGTKIDSKKQKRAETVGKIILGNGNLVVNVIFVLMLLAIFGLDVRPILAGLGVVGLAIGFGAQSLVKDFVSGLFILAEDQYGIGDKIQIGTFIGKVRKITLRSTVIEDENGAKCYVANGSIVNVTNFSQK
jgi:small conductance mechanosensitive channel